MEKRNRYSIIHPRKPQKYSDGNVPAQHVRCIMASSPWPECSTRFNACALCSLLCDDTALSAAQAVKQCLLKHCHQPGSARLPACCSRDQSCTTYVKSPRPLPSPPNPLIQTCSHLHLHIQMHMPPAWYPQVRTKAAKLLLKQPLSACSLEVQQQAAEANRARHNRLGSHVAAPGAAGRLATAPAPPALPAAAPAAKDASVVQPSGRPSRFGPIPIQLGACEAMHSLRRLYCTGSLRSWLHCRSFCGKPRRRGRLWQGCIALAYPARAAFAPLH